MHSTSSSKGFDFKAIDLKVGLEIHQQLSAPSKLFCACPSYSSTQFPTGESRDEIEKQFPIQFFRVLRPVSSELGQLDVAAKFESRREIRVGYAANPDTSCLVEADEEPPHPISRHALETSLLFALALGSRVIDEIHVMRKIVVDGSNTAGFQRTVVIALGGNLNYGSGESKVAVQSVCLEEDAARALDPKVLRDKLPVDASRVFSLDRLGTPLVEVALAPIENGTPKDVEVAAAALGHLMRSTGRVARGLGTIRQDLNVSIMGGKVVEVKGVQKLEQISSVIECEASRQKFLVDLAAEIRERTGDRPEISTQDVTEVFRNTESQIIRSSLSKKVDSPIVLSILIKKFGGLIGKEDAFGFRLGKEMGSIARAYGLGGVFHSDELPNYGIKPSEVYALGEKIWAKESDAFVLIVGNKEKVLLTSEAIMQRLRIASCGVPAETRAATPGGETVFLRPRPGSARMYPETDIPLIELSREYLESLKRVIPEPWEKQVTRFSAKYELPIQVGEQLYDSDRKSVFEQIVTQTGSLSPRFVASVLIDTLQSLEREGVHVEKIKENWLREMFQHLEKGVFAKEAIPDILKTLSETQDPQQTYSRLSSLTIHELREIAQQVVLENREALKSKGIAAKGAIIGKVMQKVRGKIDGKIVSEVLDEQIAQTLKEMGSV